MVGILAVFYWALLIAVGAVLVQRYLRTRNGGYLLFFLAIPLWPLLSWPLSLLVRNQIDNVANYDAFAFPISLLGGTMGEVVVSIHYLEGIFRTVLLLVGFLLLNRSRGAIATEPPNSALQPTGTAGG